MKTSSYARVLAIDTHVVLETRPLDQLPWSEMGDGPILLVVCRQVQSEIDAKKGDRRLGERSRAFNRLLDPNVETGVPATLRAAGPRVDVAVMRNARIDWEAHDDLDRDDPDDRIPSRFSPPGVYDDSSLLDRYHEWRDRLVRVDLPAMHEGLTRLHSQQRLRVIVRNVGAMSAEGLSLEIRSGNATLHASPFGVRVFGEPAPDPEERLTWLGRPHIGDMASARRDEPFTIHPETPASGPVLGWSCRSFRQERCLSIETSVELLDRTGSKVRIEAVVTAANLKGDVRAQVVVDVDRRIVGFSEAYDVDGGRMRIPLPFAAARTGDEDLIMFRNDGSTIY